MSASSRLPRRSAEPFRAVVAGVLGVGFATLASPARAQGYLPFLNGSDVVVSFPGSDASGATPNFYFRCFPEDSLYGPAAAGAAKTLEVKGFQWGLSKNDPASPLGTPVFAVLADPGGACLVSASVGAPQGTMTPADILGAPNALAAFSFYTPIPCAYPVSIWLTFDLASAVPLPNPGSWTETAEAFDSDGDADLDLFVGQGTRAPQVLLEGDGAGAFADASAKLAPVSVKRILAAETLDLEGDVDTDLLLGSDGENLVYLRNDGASGFTDQSALVTTIVATTRALEAKDFDGDLRVDMLVGNDGAASRFLFNTGVALLAAQAFPAQPVRAIGAGDFDGDADVDAVFGCDGQIDVYVVNDGAATFTDQSATSLPQQAYATQALAVADFDGDSDLDFAAGNSNQANLLYRNDGTGVFAIAPSSLPSVAAATRTIDAGDFDGDLDADLWVGNGGGPDAYLENDGTGVFTDASSPLHAFVDDTRAVEIGDLDGDADLDAFLGNFGVEGPSGHPTANRIALGDGAGAFAEAPAASFPTTNESTGNLILLTADPLNTLSTDQQYLVASTNEVGTSSSISSVKYNTIFGLTASLNSQTELDLVPILAEPTVLPERNNGAVFDPGGRSGYHVTLGPGRKLRFRAIDGESAGTGAVPLVFANLIQGTPDACHAPGFSVYGHSLPINLDLFGFVLLALPLAGGAYSGSGAAIWNPAVGLFPPGDSVTPSINIPNNPFLANLQLCFVAASVDLSNVPPFVAVTNGSTLRFE